MYSRTNVHTNPGRIHRQNFRRIMSSEDLERSSLPEILMHPQSPGALLPQVPGADLYGNI
ncbi:hypothetical protein BIW11_03650 [Tropilaelaps mercedesae]|uniref:Uncharacterized protein n=1 Tax=Tropilaelaps mercedesae TaxID=418985 RepID=A0A1V9XI88_9ACAR|nr:hypothetical protein BIW11_03650 [Tropilaelaps mercedesae]